MESVQSSTGSIQSPMEDVLQLSNRSYSAGDRLKMCCRPSYRIRKLKNKGALLILVWNFLVTSVFYYLYLSPRIFHPYWHVYSIAWGLTLPIAGWLADVYLKRYKVIRWSILIMWIAFVLLVASSVLSQFVESYYSIKNNYINAVLLFIMSLAFGGYQANVVLFGIDQLQDASTDEITSFISWYSFTYFGGGIVIFLIDMYLGGAYNGLLEEFIICICLTIMIISIFLFDNILLKEPITQNPFRLIYKVIKYAIKTKHPRCRSAFTYCEDELPSRIDFGKHKYGGPFTTEEVENVKTFLRLLANMFVGTSMVIGMFSLYNLGNQLILSNNQDIISLYKWFHKPRWKVNYTPINLVYYLTGVVFVPLQEFVFYPLLWKHLSCVQNYNWKVFVGVISQIANVITLIVIDLTAHHSYLEHNNTTIQCIFTEENDTLSSAFDMKWMILPHLFNSFSLINFATCAFEIICSQSPYSMRGLLFGAMYGGVVLYCAMGFAILQPFTMQSAAWGTGVISCEFWYLLLILLILILYGIILGILMKWYKKRKREDVLPNEQVFAERYYTS